MGDFNKIAKDRGYSEIYYPYAEKGPKLIRRVQNLWFFSFTAFIVSFLFRYVESNIVVKQMSKKELANFRNSIDTMSNFQIAVTESSLKFVKSMGLISENEYYSTFGLVVLAFKGLMGTIKTLFVVLSIVLLLTSIVFMCMYLVNVVKRQREYERDVIKNDFKAVMIYRKLMGSLKIGARLREARKAAKPKKSGDSYELPSTDSISKVEELKYMKKLQVQVNTRQKLGSDMISTVYLIFIDLPTDDLTVNNLVKRIESLDETTTRLIKGEVVMGKHMLSDDRQRAIFRGETIEVPDPYNYDAKLKMKQEEVKEDIQYESSYSLSNLIDKRAEIEQKTEAARGWAERQGKLLDSYLITGKMNVTRYKTIVSSTKATFIYDLAHDSSLSTNQGKLDEALDKTFGLRGANSRIEEGKLVVVFPMPKAYAIPIDVPSLYREAFG